MENCGNIITSLDLFSLKTHLTLNERGDIRYKNIYGGFLSLLYLIISFSFIMFFVYNFFEKKDLNVIYSVEKDNFITIPNSDKFPFMIRLSDYFKNTLNNENLYNISFKYLSQRNEDVNNYISDDIIIEQCDLNKHFGEYKKYFETIQNVNSYYCINQRLLNQSLYRVNGKNANFSYYNFNFTKCIKTENENCYDEKEINKILNNAYLDFIYVDYSIDHYNYKNPSKLLVKSKRLMISSTINKKLNLYFKQVKYITDNGIIFPKETKKSFHQFHSIIFDNFIDNNYDKQNNFLSLYIANFDEISVYYRKYLKVYDYLSYIIGMIKTLSFIIEILTFHFSKNSYYIKMIKEFLIENQLEKKNSKKNLTCNFSSLNNSDLNLVKSNNILFSSNLEYKLKEKELIETKFKYKCLPITLNFTKGKDLEIIERLIKIINNRLNIIGILNKLEIIENFKKENQNHNSFLFNNSNTFQNIEWKEKDNKLINSSFNSKKINNFLSLDDKKFNSNNTSMKTSKSRTISKFYTPK